MKFRNLKKCLSLFLAMLMVLTCVPVVSLAESNPDTEPEVEIPTSGICGENVTWTFDEATGTLTISGTGDMKDFFDAASFLYYQDTTTKVIIKNGVTSICDQAFSYWHNITEVIIPNSVTTIEEHAFYGCTSLTSITIPDSVTSIGSYAFYNTGYYNNEANWENNMLYIDDCLVDVKYNASGIYEIKENTRVITDNIFTFSNIKEINVPSTNEYYTVENSILFNKDKTTLIKFPAESDIVNYAIPNSVISIGNWAFSGCSNLTSITMPNSVTSIGSHAFYSCSSLASITIPDSVTSIDYDAFYNTGYYNNESNWENDVLYIGNHLIEAKKTLSGSYEIKKGTKLIAYQAFNGCYDLTKITIPDSVTIIEKEAFSGLGVTEISIPDSVIEIKKFAFGGCSNLKKVTIGNGVKIIGDRAFEGCESLTDITLGTGLTTIGSGAFFCCSGLLEITIPSNVEKIEYAAFLVSGLENAYFESADTLISRMIVNEDGFLYTAIPETATIHAPCVITEGKGVEYLTPYKYANKYLDSRFVSIDDNHNYTDWTTVTEPTIDAPGKEVRACVACEIKEERELTYTAVENITINISDIVLEEGNTTTIIAAVTPENVTNATLTYSSSDETVATVVDGVITAIGNGTAIITVSAAENPDIKATVNVKVSVPVTEFDVTVDAEEVVEGETATITTNIPSDDVTVTYESLTPEYATVDANGVITAVASGEAVVKVTVTDAFGNVTEKTVTLTVKADFVPVTDIEVAVDGELKYVGDTIEIVAAVNPEATDKTFTFEVSSNLVAREENDKIVITAVGEGVATLTITAGDYYETFTFGTVKAKPSFTITAPTDVKLGDMGQIVVTPNIEGTYAIEYESSDESVVTVDDNGNIIAIGAGTATVTAKVILEDGTVITKTVTVKSTDPNAGKLFCSFCDDYEKMKDGPVGFIYTIIHFIVHFVETIKFAT